MGYLQESIVRELRKGPATIREIADRVGCVYYSAWASMRLLERRGTVVSSPSPEPQGRRSPRPGLPRVWRLAADVE